MEAWWEGLSDTVQAAWLAAFEAGRVEPSLIDTLPPDRGPSKVGRWVWEGTIQHGGQPGADWQIKLDLQLERFLAEEYDRRREE